MFVYGMTSRGFLRHALVLLLPGILLLAGGRSPAARRSNDPGMSTSGRIADALYPDHWTTLAICSILICLPGLVMVVGADYLAEVGLVGFRPVNPTPAGVWRGLGYLVAIGLSIYALLRAINAWK